MTLEQQTELALARTLKFVNQHRRGVIASMLAAMGGFAITAVAIAPLAPDASQLPQRLLTESVQTSGLPAQLEALALQNMALRRNDLTRSTDSAQSLLGRLGVNDAEAAVFLRSDSTARLLLSGRSGKMVQAETREDSSLVELVGRFPSDRSDTAKTHFNRLSMTQVEGRWLARLQSVPYGGRTRLSSGVIRSSLFAATDEAGLPDSVAAQVAEIFSADIDFHRQLRKGDSFSVVYETLTADGEPVAWNEGAGRVLAAEFIANGRARHAVWFTPADGRGGYFGLDGESRRRTFLASPMEFSRVTSGFAQRFHPILQTWRKHLGVDYGAPTGTAVRSVGEGQVEFAGWQNGYGNVVQLRHGKTHETLYAHLSRIDVSKGQRVQQGQTVGAVGSTGWSTGPHLHFEFRINGEHQDPLLIAKASETLALDAASRKRFAETAQAVKAKLDIAETVSRWQAKAD